MSTTIPLLPAPVNFIRDASRSSQKKTKAYHIVLPEKL